MPKIGRVRYYDSRPLEGVVVQVTVKREANFWYMHVVCEIESDVVKFPVSIETALGIDLGLSILRIYQMIK